MKDLPKETENEVDKKNTNKNTGKDSIKIDTIKTTEKKLN